MRFLHSVFLSTLSGGVLALPFLSSDVRNSSVSTIYQFPESDRWFENLAVRPNGMIIATELTAPKLWMIDPHDEPTVNGQGDSDTTIRLLSELPEYLGLLGITEYQSDVFAFIAGNFSIAEGFTSQADSYAVWSIDFNHKDPQIRKIADVPEAEFLNGIAYLESEDSLLLGDAGLGVVWKLDLKNGLSSLLIEDPLMKKVSEDAPDGINGLKLYDNELWFTRGYDAIVAKMQIFDNGTAVGDAEIVGRGKNSTWTMDDLVVNKAGEAYVAIPFQNMIARFDSANNEPVVVAGNINSTEIAEPTSLAFARTAAGITDERVLYVATGGAIADPINGAVTVGGQIVKVELGRS